MAQARSYPSASGAVAGLPWRLLVAVAAGGAASALELPRHAPPERGGRTGVASVLALRRQAGSVASVLGSPRGPEFFAGDGGWGDGAGAGSGGGRVTDVDGQAAAEVAGAWWEQPDKAQPVDPLPERRCHPRCLWQCDKSECDKTCTPVCQAPVCTTACRSPLASECRQVCDAGDCAVVCPGRDEASRGCSAGHCPGCQTLCSKPRCRTDCGQHSFCNSTCADPVCSWQCENATCPEPVCRLTCDGPKICGLAPSGANLHGVYAAAMTGGLGDDGTLDARRGLGAAYAGKEITWRGLANVSPTEQVGPAETPTGSAAMYAASPPGGSQAMGGAKPLPGPCDVFCNRTATARAGLAIPLSQQPPSGCLCGYTATATVADTVDWAVGP